MKTTLLVLALSLLSLSPALPAAESCSLASVHKSDQNPGPWIDQGNWLAPENLRFGLPSANHFMSLTAIRSSATPQALKPAQKPLDLDKAAASDPLDRTPRDIGFLLATRIYADGIVVLRNGRVLSERYWNGASAPQPRFLLGASRPVLSLLGAMALAQGKLAADKSVIRYIPALSAQTGLRKLSIQRLIEGNGRFNWTDQEINDWQAASGWRPGSAGEGLRAWLKQAERWERSFADGPASLADGPASLADATPDADLLAWALSETYKTTLAQVLCDQVLSKLRPEHPVFWATDPVGGELADGLALSLRDFARFGQMLIEARNSPHRSKIPNWFIETLTASGGSRKGNTAELIGLSRGSELRYGFIHLGGTPNRIALLGPYGNSLYVDFDLRLVIAIFAAYPKENSSALLASLEQIWERVDQLAQANGKR